MVTAYGPFFGLGLVDFTVMCIVSSGVHLGTLPFKFLTFIHPQPITSAKEFAAMIEVTRLNGSPIVLNSDLIKIAEASPDTMLTLINGEKLIVREEPGEVVERVLAYRAKLLAAVARRMPAPADLERVVSLSSLDVAGQSGGPPEQIFPRGQ